jgi:hypothetical protein
MYLNSQLDVGIVEKITMFKICHQNIRSLRPKLDIVDLLVEDKNKIQRCDVITFTEHWLSDDETRFMQLANYQLIDFYCRKEKKGGGSCIYVHNAHIARQRDEFKTLNVDQHFECSIIELIEFNHVRIKNTIIMAIYRAPSGDFQLFLKNIDKVLSVLITENKYIFMLGDFNVDFKGSSNDLKELIHIMGSYNLAATIREATRVTKTSATTIDNIFTNVDSNMWTVGIHENGLSDHTEQDITVNDQLFHLPGTNKNKQIKKLRNKGNFVRKISKQKIQDFTETISTEEWRGIEPKNDVNKNFNCFMAIFIQLYNKSFPMCRIKPNINKTNILKGKQWLTDHIRLLSAKSKEIFKEASLKNCSDLKAKYALCKRELKLKIKEAKMIYHTKLINNAANKPKKLWNIVKDITGTPKDKIKANLSIKEGSNLLEDPKLISNAFNDYFLNVSKNLIEQSTGVNEEQERICIEKIQTTDHSISLKPATREEIIKIVKRLKNSESTGVDGVKVSVIKKSILAFVDVFTFLINQMLSEGVFPQYLKEAILIPIFKNKGIASEMGNYRPLALLTIFSKIYENVIKSRLVDYLEYYSLLDNNQFGFRAGKSTANAINNNIAFLLQSIDDSNKTMGLFCDLQKAFDCLDHKLLLLKLNKLGIRDTSANLIKSYLEDRQQKVEVKFFNEDGSCLVTHSKSGKLEYGVPQGSVLGPLLFIIYMNDLRLNISNAHVTIFADDTTIAVSGSNAIEVCNNMNTAIDQASTWFKINKLVLNASKTKLMIFNNVRQKSNNDNMSVFNNGNVIQTVESTVFLGLVVDNHLNWKEQVNALQTKLNRACFALRILRHQLPLKFMKNIYLGYFESLIRYGILFWGGSQAKQKIFKIQKTAIRILFKRNRSHSCRYLFKILKVMTLHGMYIYELILYIRRFITDFNQGIHEHNTRSKNVLRTQQHKTALFEQDVTYRGIIFYNMLPLCIKSLNNYNSFKHTLKLFIINKRIYSIKEFENACIHCCS